MKHAARPVLDGWRLVVLAVCAAASCFGVLLGGAQTAVPDARSVLAMERFVRAQELLWEERDRRIGESTRRELLVTDPLHSGLVGVEWSSRTTTPGALTAKRTTIHPLWVPVFGGWYRQIGLRPGDVVAIAASGSFPAMVLAARIAAESMQLTTVMIGSLTSSNYGANLPEMDLATMDHVLRQAGLLQQAPVAFTPGGDEDRGADLEPTARAELVERIHQLGPLGHVPSNLEASVRWRETVLLGSTAGDHGSGSTSVLVNIGGHAANYGVGAAPLALPSGLIGNAERAQIPMPEAGMRSDSVVFRALRRGIPVINVLNIRGLAMANGVPIEPVRIPEPATVRLAQRLGIAHRTAAATASVLISLWLLAWRVRDPGSREWFELGRRIRAPQEEV